MLATKTIAPDFELYSTPDQKLKLSQLRNKEIVLKLYPADWSLIAEREFNQVSKDSFGRALFSWRMRTLTHFALRPLRTLTGGEFLTLLIFR